MSKKDYYQILNVSRSATKEEIKKAYKKLAIENHPDRHKDEKDKYEKIFKDIAEAYSILSDDIKKANYDRYGSADTNSGFSGHSGSSGFSDFGFDVGDIFESFFGDRSQKSSSRRKQEDVSERGSDLRYNLSLKLEETLNSIRKNISFSCLSSCQKCKGFGTKTGKRESSTCEKCKGSGVVNLQQGFFFVQQTCNNCYGKGFSIKDPCLDCRGEGRIKTRRDFEVTIPAGVEDGMMLKQENLGESGLRGGRNGDLFLKIEIQQHKIFKKEDRNLILDIPITFTQAVLGDSSEIKGLAGEKIEFKIPKNSTQDSKIKITNSGLPYYNSTRKGDLILNVKIEIPQKITKEQEELLIKLHESFTKDNHPNKTSFFDSIKSFFN